MQDSNKLDINRVAFSYPKIHLQAGLCSKQCCKSDNGYQRELASYFYVIMNNTMNDRHQLAEESQQNKMAPVKSNIRLGAN